MGLVKVTKGGGGLNGPAIKRITFIFAAWPVPNAGLYAAALNADVRLLSAQQTRYILRHGLS